MKKDKIQKTQDRYRVPAVEQASRILFSLAEGESSHTSLTKICKKIGIHSSRAFYILNTLQEFGLVQKDVGGKGYSLGPNLITLSRKVLDNFNAPRLAEPILEQLGKKADSTAFFGLIFDDQLSIVAKYEGNKTIDITVRVGTRFHITHGAEGKAITAFLPREEVEKLVRGKNLFFKNKPGKQDREELLKELADIRHLGFALNSGRINPKFNAVAAPVFGMNGDPIGHITVVGIMSTDWARRLGPSVVDAAKNLSRQMGAVTD